MKRLSVLALMVSCSLAGAVETRPERELKQLDSAIKAFPNVDWARYRFLSFGVSENLVGDRKTTKMVVATVTKSNKEMSKLVTEMTPTLYALDLVNLGWTPEMWDEMSKEWVYYKDITIPDGVLKATKTQFPIMRFDVFVNEAWLSKWYAKFLSLPQNREQLYDELGINIDNPKYAGTISNTLTVTGHPGKVAFYQGKWGSVYVRMNYDNTRGRNDSKRHPLNFDCQYNTVQFQLPNGLDGYASYDGETHKLSRFSDTRVEKDVKGHSVELGRSCFECHTGTRQLKNLDDVRDLYLEPSWIRVFDKKKLQEQAHQDSDRWAITLRSMIDMSPEQWEKHVIRIQTGFSAPISLNRMAKEFGVDQYELEQAMHRSDNDEVVQCVQNHETWTRDRFEEHYSTILSALRR